jgi:hypothetical protein
MTEPFVYNAVANWAPASTAVLHEHTEVFILALEGQLWTEKK